MIAKLWICLVTGCVSGRRDRRYFMVARHSIYPELEYDRDKLEIIQCLRRISRHVRASSPKAFDCKMLESTV